MKTHEDTNEKIRLKLAQIKSHENLMENNAASTLSLQSKKYLFTSNLSQEENDQGSKYGMHSITIKNLEHDLNRSNSLENHDDGN